jgi:methionyl-tRNA formyltransferase
MRVVFFGSGDFGIPTLRALTDPRKGKHQVVAVVTQPDRGSGRGRKTHPTPIKAKALELGLDVIAPEDVNTRDVVSRLGALRADIGVVVAFGQKVGAEVRGLFRHECVNLHASLLPKYRGAAPYQWAILQGDEKTGVTVFRLVDRMDAGPVFVTRWTEIKVDERAADLHDRLAGVGVDAIEATLERLEAEPDWQPTPQDETAVTKAPKLRKEDGYLRFERPAEELARRVCGLWSWPGARCQFVSLKTGKSENVTIALARVGDANPAGEAPGTIDYRRFVATGSGYLEVLEIQPDGARVMPFPDFVNGRHVAAGDRFASLES